MVRATAALVTGLWHKLFNATLAVKGSLASIEAMVGFGLWLGATFASAPKLPVEGSIEWLNQHEITQDPQDPMVQWTAEQAQHLSVSSDNFYALYLIVHGLLKLVMVILLARRVTWAYPAAMAVLAVFVAFQLHSWTQTHSPFLIMLSGFDLFMIYLVGREYRLLKSVA